MNAPFSNPMRAASLEPVDALLMDVARRIQISPTKHDQAEQHFRALCQYVDREGSPLQGKVLECYPSGSFATGTAVASRVSANQHDVDVVIELNVSPYLAPERVLTMLFEAINGERGSRYHGKVKLNSRCVTVEYDDGTTVDLMPVARLAGEVDRAGHLFHHKPETGEAYHKLVNPWGFAKHFNDRVELDPAFYETFQGRRVLIEGMLETRADTQPMPDHVPLEQKSPRVVALQLIKRARDIAHRGRPRGSRKPPSIVTAALALDAGPVRGRLVDEVIAVADHIRGRLQAESGRRQVIEVRNPSYPPDQFTDRWPGTLTAQDLYIGDLRRLVVGLYRLRNDAIGPDQMREELERLFGETAARYAVESFMDARRLEAEAGCLHLGPRGRVLTGSAAAVAVASGTARTARGSTLEGGGSLP